MRSTGGCKLEIWAFYRRCQSYRLTNERMRPVKTDQSQTVLLKTFYVAKSCTCTSYFSDLDDEMTRPSATFTLKNSKLILSINKHLGLRIMWKCATKLWVWAYAHIPFFYYCWAYAHIPFFCYCWAYAHIPFFYYCWAYAHIPFFFYCWVYAKTPIF